MEREKLIKIVTAAQRGDEKALNRLFNAYYNDVYYFALKTVKEEELACDITQETFVRIIENIGTLQEPAAFVTWMKQITYHNCLGYFKKKKDILVEEDEDGHSVFDTLEEDRAEFIPDEALDQQDFRKTILDMLDNLSPEQRSATMLYYYDEMSVRQIAQIQGVSEGTVKSRLNYARKAIKASVEDYEKKNNVKLHSVGMFSLFAWLFSGTQTVMSGAAAATVALGIATATGTSISVSGGATVAAAMSVPLAAKIIGAVLAGSLVVGGIGVAVTAKPDSEPPRATDTILAESTEQSSTETAPIPEETQPPEETKPTETEPTETEPMATEPPETVPEETVPLETAPSAPEPTEPEPDNQSVVPAGCTYMLADGTELLPGQVMPDKVSDGDKFITGDYTYEYTYGLMTSDTRFGWSATVKDESKTSYEPLLAQINGEPLVSLAFAFMGCKNMTTAPAIPSSVLTLDRAFYACRALTQAPAIPDGVINLSQAFMLCTALKAAPKLPSGITNLFQTFNGCESLTDAPVIPYGVTQMYQAFSYCRSLRTAPEIPASVYSLDQTFAHCTSLTTAPAIPNSVTTLQRTFEGCSALTAAPKIPGSVTSLRMTFSGCTSLTSAPVIPGSVTDLYQTFYNCSALSGEVVIHANPLHYSKCFHGTRQNILLTGSCTMLPELAATGNNENIFY